MQIKIKELALENFKGHRALTLTPGGQNMSIYGDNATGKTTIYDAFTWLLFGTDSVGNGEKSIEIKPLNQFGEVADHDAVTSVKAVLLVNGEEVSLHRTLQEVWSTKRGCEEPVYGGNVSEYFVDGVPVKANAFKSRIEEMISPDLFKLLTNVHYFPNELHWQKRREKLFEIAGAMSDAEIMATDSRFAPLQEALGKLTVEQFKAKVTAEKKAMTGARNEIPARINECTKSIEVLSELDFDGARREVDVLNGQIETLQADLAKIENNTAIAEKRGELREAQFELGKLESENKIYRAGQAPANPNEKADIASRIAIAAGRADALRLRQKQWATDIAGFDKKIDGYRAQWKEENGKTFSAGSCPTCGQDLPADQLKAAREKFEAEKQRKLRETEYSADYLKNMKQTVEHDIANAKGEEAELRAEIEVLKAKAAELESTTIVIKDMPDYEKRKAGFQKWIDQVQEELQALGDDSRETANTVRQEIMHLKRQISEQMEIIGKQSVLAFTQERIDQLRADAARAAEKLAEAEKFLFLIDEYGRYKAKFVEDTVNSLFKLCSWRLFREQANGGIEDRCDATYGGVPYTDLNSGAKINVGIDIINTLSRAYGVAVPLIVDNAESVTNLEATNTQVIRLVVSEQDKALRVVYHN